MGHYREDRPQPWEDRMKIVEFCYKAVKKINNSPFQGFSVWEKGKHIIPPARRQYLKELKDRANNRGFKPRVGIPMDIDINHTRNVKGMVDRILAQNKPIQRRLNSHNVDMHPAFLRRSLVRAPPRKSPKKKPSWQKSTLTHGRHSPYLTAEERYQKFVNRVKCPNIPARRVSGLMAVPIRDGTPFSMTPKPLTKLIDATHGLWNRNLFDYRKSVSKSLGNQPKDFMNRIGSDDVEMVKIYSNVLQLPDAVSHYLPSPHVKKKKTAADMGWHRNWIYEMDNKDLPSDLKITPSDHAIDDPIRSGLGPNLDPFTEPQVLYNEEMVPLDHLPSPISSPSSFGMHGYGSLPDWSPPGTHDFLEKDYQNVARSDSSGWTSGASSPRWARRDGRASGRATPVPPWSSGTSSPLYCYDPSASRNATATGSDTGTPTITQMTAPNWISPFYSYDKSNFRNVDGSISRRPSIRNSQNRGGEGPKCANPESGVLGSEMSSQVGTSDVPPLTPLGNPTLDPIIALRATDEPPWTPHKCCENPY